VCSGHQESTIVEFAKIAKVGQSAKLETQSSQFIKHQIKGEE